MHGYRVIIFFGGFNKETMPTWFKVEIIVCVFFEITCIDARKRGSNIPLPNPPKACASFQAFTRFCGVVLLISFSAGGPMKTSSQMTTL